MKLYSVTHSPFATRVRMALLAKGRDIPIAEPPGGLGSDAFRAIIPLAMVPALELDDGRILPESEVIIDYLEDRFPEPPLRPESSEDRATARLLARLADLYLAEPLRTLFEETKGGTAAQSTLDKTLPPVRQALTHIDRYLDSGSHAVGGRLSTADCALVPMLFFVNRSAPLFPQEDPFGGLPKLSGYWGAIQSNPVAAKVLSEMEDAQRERAAARARGEFVY